MENKKEEFSMEKIVELLKKSEDDGTFLEALYDLYFFIGIAKGLNDAKNGKGITLEEHQKEMEARYENYNRRFR